jgi:hypothetical protein
VLIQLLPICSLFKRLLVLVTRETVGGLGVAGLAGFMARSAEVIMIKEKAFLAG